MNRNLLACCIFFLLVFEHAYAQKEYNMWYFGDHAGVTFNTNPPSALTDGAMYSGEGCSGICDENGNLLFYTNGDTVWNKDHHFMKNGISAIHYDMENAVQGAIVLKKPGSDHLYYIFCPESDNGLTGSYVRYWVIDMNMDSGKGEAIIINQPIVALVYPNEKVAVTKHANGDDFWIGAINGRTGDFNCVRTVNGELDVNVSTTSINAVSSGIGTCKFSPDGKILFSFAGYSPVKGAIFFLYHFDNATGLLSDKMEIAMPNRPWCGLEFSHDSKFLYVAYPENNMTFSNKIIIQYDLSNWDESIIDQSATTIYSVFSPNFFGGLQLGPDKKIYVFQAHKDSVAVIDYPYLKGDSCHYRANAISLNGRISQVGGPYYPNYWYNSLHISGNWQLCEGDSTTLNSNAPSGSHIKWNTGDTIPAIVVKTSGAYWVMAINGKDTLTDSVAVKVGKKFPVYLGSDTAFCGAFSFLLKAGKNAKSYQWSTGDTTISILVDQPGMYSVAIKDSNSCPAGDTILIDQLLAPSIALQYDSNCQYVQLDASPRQKDAHYLWSTGDTTLIIHVEQKGEYKVTISNMFCSISQVVVVNAIHRPCEKMVYYIPNAFTPGNDGLNETFKVVGNMDEVNIRIYNRWGMKIYEGPEWDGTSNGKPCQQGAYLYQINITGTDKGTPVTKQVSGNVTLLR